MKVGEDIHRRRRVSRLLRQLRRTATQVNPSDAPAFVLDDDDYYTQLAQAAFRELSRDPLIEENEFLKRLTIAFDEPMSERRLQEFSQRAKQLFFSDYTNG